MKPAFLLVFSLFALSAFSQFENLYKRKPWEDYRKKYNFRNRPAPMLSPKAVEVPEQDQQDPAVKKLPLKGKYLGTNDKGDDIYAMQPDNMPCLVPGAAFRSNMPVTNRKRSGLSFKEKEPAVK